MHAAAVSGINEAKDRPELRQDDFPAFVVLGRNKEFESATTSNAHYNGAWEYQCMILVKMDRAQVNDATNEGDDFVELEGYFDEFCDRILGDGIWELLGAVEFGAYTISGKQALGVAFTLGKHGVDRYGN